MFQVLYATEGENRRPEEIGHDMSAQVGNKGLHSLTGKTYIHVLTCHYFADFDCLSVIF